MFFIKLTSETYNNIIYFTKEKNMDNRQKVKNISNFIKRRLEIEYIITIFIILHLNYLLQFFQ